MHLPNCQVGDCKNDAFVRMRGKWICGEHFLKIKKKQDEAFWEQIK